MNRFTKNDDGTVTDTKTGLIWSQTLMDGKDRPFEEAEQAVKALGEGWRMPTIDELMTLVDRTRYEPAIDVEAFPDTKNDWYWSDTPCAWRPTSAVWVVYFDLGYVDDGDRDDYACVRAVRASQ